MIVPMPSMDTDLKEEQESNRVMHGLLSCVFLYHSYMLHVNKPIIICLHTSLFNTADDDEVCRENTGPMLFLPGFTCTNTTQVTNKQRYWSISARHIDSDADAGEIQWGKYSPGNNIVFQVMLKMSIFCFTLQYTEEWNLWLMIRPFFMLLLIISQSTVFR